MKEPLSGLSAAEVEMRRIQGEGGSPAPRITKSRGQIIRENVFTLFHLLNFLLAALLFAVGAYSNMLFIAIIILNIIIGTAQELKAKKLVDELSLLGRPRIRVRRSGKDVPVELEEVVKDDLLVLESGNQICCDAVVVEGMLEVNESLLTGESDGVVKEEGGELLSGSFVIAGKALARVIHVGDENYAAKLANAVKREKETASELLGSMRKVTHFTSFFILPLGIVLLLEALFLRGASTEEAVVSSAAALLGMLPKGLVLLISVSLAAGVIRLAKSRILVQNIYALETLAHADVLCLDKTGTITDGRLRVCRAEPMTEGSTKNESFWENQADWLIKSYLAASDDNNATFQALKAWFGEELLLEPFCKIPFSSKRKWGSVSFSTAGTVFVGAPEKLLGEDPGELTEKLLGEFSGERSEKLPEEFSGELPGKFSRKFSGKLPAELEQEMKAGYRVIVIGYYGDVWTDSQSLPQNIRPLYSVVLEDTIRPNAASTLEFFRKEGVQVKILSGDHGATVSAIARKAGLADWDKAVDMSAFGEKADYDRLVREYSVFARVTPGQKQELVKALKRQGHQVAMTGDGVNDLLALREADCSIAVADGSDASRQIAQVVLLDSDFTNLPQVVMEGRRVVNNVTRTAQVFFIKTIYSVLAAFFCLFANVPFPFIPIQITLIDAFVEAWPSFVTVLEADTRRIKGRFLYTALSHAAPFGITAAVMIGAVSLAAPFSPEERGTVMYLLLILISMGAAVKSCLPFNPLRCFICATMVLGTFGALALLPSLFGIVPVTAAMGRYVLAWALGCGLLIFLFEKGRLYMDSQRELPPHGANPVQEMR